MIRITESWSKEDLQKKKCIYISYILIPQTVVVNLWTQFLKNYFRQKNKKNTIYKINMAEISIILCFSWGWG